MRYAFNQGFTLIEVMIVVAIISILAAIAIPSYQDYIRRGQLQESFALLSGFQLQMEQRYQDNRNYGDDGAGSTTCDTHIPTSNRFAFDCELGNQGQAYTLTGTGSHSALRGYAYTINERGQRRTITFKGQASTAQCWLDKSPTC